MRISNLEKKKYDRNACKKLEPFGFEFVDKTNNPDKTLIENIVSFCNKYNYTRSVNPIIAFALEETTSNISLLFAEKMEDLENLTDNKEEIVYENILLEGRLNYKYHCSEDQHRIDLGKLSIDSLKHRRKLLREEFETILKARFNGNNLTIE